MYIYWVLYQHVSTVTHTPAQGFKSTNIRALIHYVQENAGEHKDE